MQLKILNNIFNKFLADKTIIFKAVLALLAVSAINLSIPAIVRKYIPELGSFSTEIIIKMSVVLVVLFLLQGFFSYFRIFYFNILGHKIAAKLRQKVFRDILSRDISFFDQQRSGDLISRLNADSQLVQEVISTKVSVLLRYSLQVAGGLLLMIWLSLKLTLVIALSFPFLVLISIFLAKKLKYYSSSIQSEMGKAATIAEESFAGIKVLHIFQQIDKIAEIFNEKISYILSLAITRSKISAFLQSFVSFLLYSLIIIFLFYGLHLAGNAQISFQDLSAFIMYALIVAISFSFLAGTIDDFSKGMAAAERLIQLESETKNASKQNLKPFNTDTAWDINFKDVSFTYPGRELPVFDNFNLAIPANKFSIITGTSGNGKSTIANLILSFYTLNSGQILFNNQDLSQLDQSSLLPSISYVPQNPTIFDLSIKENLLLGNPDVSDEKMRSICDELNLLEFIEGLPEKFNTLCGKHGLELSGGQQQRLALARAFLRPFKLLILDEATSSLDNENEAIVLEFIKKNLASSSVIMITHRVAAMQAADLVIYLGEDSDAEYGTHEELLEKSELYRTLIN